MKKKNKMIKPSELFTKLMGVASKFTYIVYEELIDISDTYTLAELQEIHDAKGKEMDTIRQRACDAVDTMELKDKGMIMKYQNAASALASLAWGIFKETETESGFDYRYYTVKNRVEAIPCTSEDKEEAVAERMGKLGELLSELL